jgi:menaquinone-dependent protoporphyrinogen oxidase
MRVLVVVASRHGATAEIADEIACTLRESKVAADVLGVRDTESLDGYDAVVLGSAVYMGRWLERASRFAKAHADELSQRPTWLFSSGPVGDPPKPAESAPSGIEQLIDATGARGHRVFAGRIDRSRLNLPERAVMRAVGGTEGDFRDWDEIRAWAGEIANSLTTPPIS